MRRVYYLLSRISDGLQHTAKTLEEYMTKHVGFEIIDAQKKRTPKDALQNAIPFIKSLIVMHKKYSELLVNCFSNHVAFKAAFDKVSAPLFFVSHARASNHKYLDIFVGRVVLRRRLAHCAQAFTEIMNRPTGKWTMPRLLTLFVDHILKGKEKETSSEAEVDVRRRHSSSPPFPGSRPLLSRVPGNARRGSGAVRLPDRQG
jgi:hypothetical protein